MTTIQLTFISTQVSDAHENALLSLAEVVEVRVAKGLLHGDAARWVEGYHSDQKVKGDFVEVFEVMFGVDGFELGEGGLHFWQFGLMRDQVLMFCHSLAEGVPWNWKILKI